MKQYRRKERRCFWEVSEGFMDISFKKIELEDKEIIEHYLKKKKYRGCDMVFCNNYLWSRFYATQFAIVEDTLVFCSTRQDGSISVTFPAGETEQIKKALEVLFAYFQEKERPFHMHLVQEYEFELLEQWYPGRFVIEYDRDAADYVYETEKLTTLAGKKLHGKRNHINNFIKQNPDWSYERITEENQEDCFQMALKWRQDHVCEHTGEENEEIRDEMCVTMNALRLREELGLVGGLLRVNGEVIAFTLGEQLNDDTFVVHIEKAYAEIQGAYPMINQQFVKHEAQNYKYVNREEDTGAEGLRKAKLSYRPAFLVNKGIVCERKDKNDKN